MSRARATAALEAMKAIGIPQQKAKPVLKELLKVYENNWEYIEAENYRVLADAIFDMQESLAEEDRRKNILDRDDGGKEVVSDELEPPRKRAGHRQGIHPLSPSWSSPDLACETSLKRPRLEADVSSSRKRDELVSSPRSHGNSTVIPAPPQSSYKQAAAQYLLPQSPGKMAIAIMSPHSGHTSERVQRTSPHMNCKEISTLNPRDEACQALCPTKRKDKQPVQEKVHSTESLEKHKIGSRSFDLVRPKDETCDYDSAVFETPIAMICPPQTLPSGKIGQASDHGYLKSYSTLKKNITTYMTQDGQRKNDKNRLSIDARRKLTASDILSADSAHKKKATSELLSAGESSCGVDIASSDLGEVKVMFSCSSNRPDFHVPNLEAVFKRVEDRCLKSYKILQPGFSLVNLMKEMCQCFWELGSETTNDKQENPLQIMPTSDSPEKTFTVPLSLNSRLDSAVHDDLTVMVRYGPYPSVKGRGDNTNKRNQKMKNAQILESADATSYSQLVVQPQHALGELRPLHDVNDITKGEEKFKISVGNEITNEKYPPLFNYIPRNIVYQNAYVNFSLARIGDENCCPDCFENCLAAPIPCACAQETGGEFAYTSEGLIRKKFLDEYISMSCEPQKHQLFYCKDCPLERSKNEILPEACRGHLVRKFIKECWSKCGCSMRCGNRVVQRGIVHDLQVFLTSEGKGWGLRTLEKLPRGAFVCEYVGEVLTNTELYDRIIQTTGNARHTYPVLLDADWGSEGTLKDEEALCLDATFYGNVARFINHRCADANLIGIPVEIESPDHHYYHLSFFTRRKVDACEELTWDYGIDFDDHSHPIKAFRCRCGSSLCRDINSQRRGPRAGCK